LNASPVQWVEPQPVHLTPEILELVEGSTFLAEMLLRRGYDTPEKALAFLNPRPDPHASPNELPDLEQAAHIIQDSVQKGELIGVWGDFDVDGQTSTTLLVSTLRRLGARVVYHIPVRAHESHGVGLAQLETFLKQGVNLVLTCDTGITAHEAVLYAHQRGVKMIITDHHTLPDALPAAEAVVNPQRLPPGHALSGLCGVGTAAKLAEYLLLQAGLGDFWPQLLDLVALGTVADVAQLTGENRWLTRQGLAQLRQPARPAIRAILKQAEVNPENLSEEHIGFVLGPRLNALGRLDDSNPIVNFLLAEEASQVEGFANQLEALNNQRKMLCDQVFKAAQSQLERHPEYLKGPVLVLSHPEWPAGVIGIAASRLVDLYHRPVIMIAAPPGSHGRASARSVEGINITQAIGANSDLLLGYGGHAMAAGFGIQPEKIEEFRAAMQRTVLRLTQGQPLVEKILVDAFLPLKSATLDLIEQLERLAPFGPGNPPVLLAAKNLTLKSAVAIGRGKEHLKLTLEENGQLVQVLWWQAAGFELPEGRFDLAYTVRASDFNGQRQVQIEWVHARLREETASAPKKPRFTPHDLRRTPDPQTVLSQLPAQDTVIWAEGQPIPQGGANRLAVRPAAHLVIWGAPPGREELQAVLFSTQPEHVYLCAHRSPPDQPAELLNHLAGLLRYAITHKAGRASLAVLAANTGQRSAAIRSALNWLQARGSLRIEFLAEGDEILASPTRSQPLSEVVARHEAALTFILRETAAYRAYYHRAEPQDILV
jgi:single-stranded-DNA-specific exonuclease